MQSLTSLLRYPTLFSFSIVVFASDTSSTTASLTNLGCETHSSKEYRHAVLQHVNHIRQQPQQCGKSHYPAVSVLKWNNKLAQSAFAHAQDIAQRRTLSHYGPQGQGLRERIKSTGYTGNGGENLASGQQTVAEVLSNWLSMSPGHCDNLMQAKYKEMALVCVSNPDTQRPYWVLHLGTGQK